jgi:hypothetical protein
MRNFPNSGIYLMAFIAFWAFVQTSCSGDPASSRAGSGGMETSANEGQGAPVISFDKDQHQFGTIFSGERVVYSFRFTNTGDAPLVITGTRSSCGCTAGEYTKDPVPPGGQGRVSVEFNSAGRNGFQSETLWVMTNTDPPDHRLRITADVVRN